MVKRFLLVFLCLLALRSGLINAQAGEAPLELNMSAAEVIRLWGEAEEKIEYEIKREELWLYPEGKVWFHSGKLTSWEPAPGTKLREYQDGLASKNMAEKKPSPSEDVPLEDILGDIMREVGDEK